MIPDLQRPVEEGTKLIGSIYFKVYTRARPEIMAGIRCSDLHVAEIFYYPTACVLHSFSPSDENKRGFIAGHNLSNLKLTSIIVDRCKGIVDLYRCSQIITT